MSEKRSAPEIEDEMRLAHCYDPRHGTPCPLPCSACEADCRAPKYAALRASHAELLTWINTAAEHLAQYRAYSERMSEMGRGLHISHEFTEASLAAALPIVIRRAEALK